MKPRTIIPPPNLQALVARHGGYDRIPAEIWIKYDRAMANWKDRLRYGEAEE